MNRTTWPTLLLFLLVLSCGTEAGREGRAPGQCSDGLDNDGDGQIDCLDSDCNGAPTCSNSGDDDDSSGDDDDSNGDDDDSNGDDDDSNGDDDAANDDDSSSAGDDDDSSPPCDTSKVLEMVCDDGCDNDGNGLTDCQDLNACLADPACAHLGDDDDSGGGQSGPCFDMPCCCEPDLISQAPTCNSCLQVMGPPPLGCGEDPSGWTPTGHLLEEGNSVCCGFGTPPTCEECTDDLDNDQDGLIDEADDSCDDWFAFNAGGGRPP